MARHAASENRPLRELLAEAQLKRNLIIRAARHQLRGMGLQPAPVHVPRAVGADAMEAGSGDATFAHTLSFDDLDVDQTLDYLAAGMTTAGEFDSNRGHFLVATGRDFRKFGLEQEHYAALAEAAGVAIERYLEGAKELVDITELTCSLLALGAEEDREGGTIATSRARVVEIEHRCSAVAVVRVEMDPPIAYWAGQFVEVRTPQTPHLWRRLSPANPCNEAGLVEFHVRAAGRFSRAIVEHAAVGDEWVVANPYGHLQVSGDRQVVMIAGSTGLAPLRALMLDLADGGNAVGNASPPSVQLFFGAKNPGELYEWQGLKSLDEAFDWLQVTAVVEQSRIPAGTNPREATDSGSGELELAVPREDWVLGQVGDVALDRGQWRGAEILVAGSPAMKRDVLQIFTAAGADPDLIQMDPD